jgi:hypothetical protein
MLIAAPPAQAAATETFLDALVAALKAALAYSRNDQTAPAALLWPDKERQWEALVGRLGEELAVLTLGPYEAGARCGPAIWIRAMLARATPGDVLPADAAPIVYLPGVAREDVRAVEQCPRALQPLAELQYRGVIWNQRNNRDWTVAAFLQSHDGGLGIDVAADGATREALVRALPKLLDEPLAHLRQQAPLRADFLDALLQPDEPRSVLLWIDNPDTYRKTVSPAEWAAFCSRCESAYGFHPEKETPIGAARRLAARSGPWNTVWSRFCEAPLAYPNLPEALRRAKPTGPLGMFQADLEEVWPQDAERGEELLRGALEGLQSLAPDAARDQVTALDADHAPRRSWVWHKLGLQPLARALEHLTSLATASKTPLGGNDTETIARNYAESAWQVDDAALCALASVDRAADQAAVRAALAATYRPWLEQGAAAFQKHAFAPGGYVASLPVAAPAGTVVLFSDGLRFDAAQRVKAAVLARGLSATLEWRLTALPSVTPTAKPAVSPVADRFGSGDGLTPSEKSSGTSVSVDVLRRNLSWEGIQVLQGQDLGDPTGSAWTEGGDIDDYGHRYGTKIASYLVGEVETLATRIQTLLESGWQRVVVVTDHGWLLLSGGLPKRDLSIHVTETRKGRCARIKDAAGSPDHCAPWYWDPSVSIAFAPDIQCYEAGTEYEHGGLSPQECVVPMLVVTNAATGSAAGCALTGVLWKGLTCVVTTGGDPSGVSADLRSSAASATASIVFKAEPKALAPDGTVSLRVPDTDLEASPAYLVLLDTSGTVIAQQTVTVGVNP